MWSNCCTNSSQSCHLKQVQASKIKWGEAALNTGVNGVGDNRRRWLVLTTTVTWSDGGGGGTVVNTQNQITGAITTAGSIPPRGGWTVPLTPPPGGSLGDSVTVSLSETQWVWQATSGGPDGQLATVTTTNTLTNEYTDDMVFADAVALLTKLTAVVNGVAVTGWDAVTLDRITQLSYDANGNVSSTIESTTLGPGPCQIPVLNQASGLFGSTALMANAGLLFPPGGKNILIIMWSRFYSQQGCLLTRYYPSDSTLPAIPDACSLQTDCGTDATGAYCDVGPVDIQGQADDPRYYTVNQELMTPPGLAVHGPSAWPNGGFAATWPGPVASDGNPWGCTCLALP